MNEFSAEAMGLVIREYRLDQSPSMTQDELARRADYGKGGAVSISRIEHGLISPREHRLAAIALALRLTPEQLKQEAEDRTRSLARQRGQRPVKLREQVAETKRRYAEVNEKAAQRSKITQEHGEAFYRVHDVVRDEFFMRFVELAKSISGAPEPERPRQEEIESAARTPTAIRIGAMSAGIANAIRGPPPEVRPGRQSAAPRPTALSPRPRCSVPPPPERPSRRCPGLPRPTRRWPSWEEARWPPAVRAWPAGFSCSPAWSRLRRQHWRPPGSTS